MNTNTNNNGIKMALLYGLTPHILGYCGPKYTETQKLINKFLGGEDHLEQKIKKILEKFQMAYAYYELIAKDNKITDPFDVKVTEAYWTSNELSRKIDPDNLTRMLKEKILPTQKTTLEKIENAPKNAPICHNWHLLHIISPQLNNDIAGLNLCLIKWGKVEKIMTDKLLVITQFIKIRNGITVIEEKEVKIKCRKNILHFVKNGDFVSIHWNECIEIVNKKKKETMQRDMEQILKGAQFQ